VWGGGVGLKSELPVLKLLILKLLMQTMKQQLKCQLLKLLESVSAFL